MPSWNGTSLSLMKLLVESRKAFHMQYRSLTFWLYNSLKVVPWCVSVLCNIMPKAYCFLKRKETKINRLYVVSVSLVLHSKKEGGRLSITQSFAQRRDEVYGLHFCPLISVISLPMTIKSTWPEYFTLGTISQHCCIWDGVFSSQSLSDRVRPKQGK